MLKANPMEEAAEIAKGCPSLKYGPRGGGASGGSGDLPTV